MQYESTKNIRVKDQSGRTQIIIEHTTLVEVKVHGITQRVNRQPQRYTTLDGRPVRKHAGPAGTTYEIIGQPNSPGSTQIWQEHK